MKYQVALMEYQEAFMPYDNRHGIQRSDYETSRSFDGTPKKQFWNTKCFLWTPKKLEGFMEYQEAFMQ